MGKALTYSHLSRTISSFNMKYVIVVLRFSTNQISCRVQRPNYMFTNSSTKKLLLLRLRNNMFKQQRYKEILNCTVTANIVGQSFSALQQNNLGITSM